LGGGAAHSSAPASSSSSSAAARPDAAPRAAASRRRVAATATAAAPRSSSPPRPARGVAEDGGTTPAAAAAQAAEPARSSSSPPVAPTARVTVLSSSPLADGTLTLAVVGPLALHGRVEAARVLRVWLPTAPPLDGAHGDATYPWLLLLDGQNVFQDSVAFAGRSWRAAHTASALIASRATPPFALVALDHGAALRSLDYLPLTPGAGAGGFRADAAGWAGGGADAFLDALLCAVLPAARARFPLAPDAARTALGGASFGAVAALHALCSGHALADAVGGLLLESPSLWVDEGRWLTQRLLPTLRLEDEGAEATEDADADAAQQAVRLPPRCYLAMGGREHSGTRPAAPPAAAADADALHARGARVLAAALRVAYTARRAQGGSGADVAAPFKFVFDADAAHCEDAWAARLPAALAFLMAPPPKAAALKAAPKAAAPPPPMLSPAQLARVQGLAASAAARGAACFFDAPRSLYVDRRRLCVPALAKRAALHARYGFDAWASSTAPSDVQLLPAAHVPSGGGACDWWCGTLSAGAPPPPGARTLCFALHDGAGLWDNARGADYTAPLQQPDADADVADADAEEEVPLRRIAATATHALAGGTLHVLTLAPRGGGDAAEARAARWQEEKTLRVWTPPAWSLANAPPGGYPVLYMCDAQNLFDDALAHQGISWRAAEALAGLIASGALPPMLLVGIDAAGAFRSLNLLPFPPGAGDGGFRPECARWPGGGVDTFLARVVRELLPLSQAVFGASARRARRAFGGASFGGVAALHAALTQAHVFGGVLAESPSLWVGEGRYLDTLSRHEGPLPERLFLGSGTREYSATREHENADLDALLARYHAHAAAILSDKGMGRDGRLKFVVDEGGGHHEGAWGWRLSGALMHLFHGRE
jgi:enterochelin esterase-like enzyme